MAIQVNDSGVWKTPKEVWVNNIGTWIKKDVFSYYNGTTWEEVSFGVPPAFIWKSSWTAIENVLANDASHWICKFTNIKQTCTIRAKVNNDSGASSNWANHTLNPGDSQNIFLLVGNRSASTSVTVEYQGMYYTCPSKVWTTGGSSFDIDYEFHVGYNYLPPIFMENAEVVMYESTYNTSSNGLWRADKLKYWEPNLDHYQSSRYPAQSQRKVEEQDGYPCLGGNQGGWFCGQYPSSKAWIYRTKVFFKAGYTYQLRFDVMCTGGSPQRTQWMLGEYTDTLSYRYTLGNNEWHSRTLTKAITADRECYQYFFMCPYHWGQYNWWRKIELVHWKSDDSSKKLIVVPPPKLVLNFRLNLTNVVVEDTGKLIAHTMYTNRVDVNIQECTMRTDETLKVEFFQDTSVFANSADNFLRGSPLSGTVTIKAGQAPGWVKAFDCNVNFGRLFTNTALRASIVGKESKGTIITSIMSSASAGLYSPPMINTTIPVGW